MRHDSPYKSEKSSVKLHRVEYILDLLPRDQWIPLFDLDPLVISFILSGPLLTYSKSRRVKVLEDEEMQQIKIINLYENKQ